MSTFKKFAHGLALASLVATSAPAFGYDDDYPIPPPPPKLVADTSSAELSKFSLFDLIASLFSSDEEAQASSGGATTRTGLAATEVARSTDLQ